MEKIDDLDMDALFKRFKKVEEMRNTAIAQKTVRQEQLDDITPQKKKIEQGIKDDIGCSIKDLPEEQKKALIEMNRLVSKIETDLKEITESNG
jgi:hypothetical protein